MDEATQQGFPAKEVAEKVLKSILKGKMDVTISTASPKLAILIRTLCPSLYFWIMERRARNSRQGSSKHD